MNYLLNPVFISKVIKSYFFDIDRLWKLNQKELRNFQDKQFRRIVNYAYTFPLYHDKYKANNVHPNDIQTLDDINKLPEISKEDIKQYYPDGIIPHNYSKKNLIEVSTSGTTGKSLSIFVDMHDIVLGIFGYIRAIKEFGINWRKDKLTIIGDFAPHTAESGYINKGLFPQMKLDRFIKNIQWLDTNDEPEKVIEEIDKFKPDFIGGYVGMLGHLALLHDQGYGKNINPKYIASTGTVLDKSLKKYIENQFDTKVFEVYGATETGPIAFECTNGLYHIMSDFLHLEFLKDGVPVQSSEPGNLIVTKLFGNGTPIIRYNAINDIVSPLYESCGCNISGGLIKRIYGRDILSLVFSDGRAMLPSGIAEIYSRVLYELKTDMLKETKIIQKDLTNIEIQVVIDRQSGKKHPPIEKLYSILEEGFHQKVGPDIKIKFKEIEKVDKKEARVISKVDRSKYKVNDYI
jgi:phenylacetate-CoA ligase